MSKLPFFYKAKAGKINFNRSSNNNLQVYLFVYLFIIGLFLAAIILRLFQLTIVKGDYYLRLSENNRIREFIIEPKRGRILDRKGFVVAQNTNADININKERLPSKRTYRSSEAIAHLVGYRQIADKNDIKNDNCLNKLRLGDKVGKKGVEKIFDCYLRGYAGKKLIEVDAKGQHLKTLTIIPPKDGQDIQLAFDLELQEKAYNLIKDKRAAAVGIKPQTGEILFFVSSPSFNVQDFEDENIYKISMYLKDKNKPLFNRVTEGAYPPGSIFKLVVGTAALEEKQIEATTIFEDTGIIKAGTTIFGNWYFLEQGKTEGMVDFVKAIRRSNDIFFYKVGEKLGAERIKLWADRFGYGKITGIGFDEAEGTIPSPFWKEENLNETWYLGDTYNLSIGQGYLLATPLQVALATAAFANNGYLCQPKLLKNESAINSSLSEYQKPKCQKLPISQKTLDLVRQGMIEACSPGGTGWPFFDFKVKNTKNKDEIITTACKTGTAESHAESGIPHAWFSVFAPASSHDQSTGSKPEIAVTVLIEEGGQGSDVAGPIAKEILKAYFERNE